MSTSKLLTSTLVFALSLASAGSAYALNPQPEPPNHNMPKIAIVLPPSPVLGR